MLRAMGGLLCSVLVLLTARWSGCVEGREQLENETSQGNYFMTRMKSRDSTKHTQMPFTLKNNFLKKSICSHPVSPTAVCMGAWEHPKAQSSFPDLQTPNQPFEAQKSASCTCRNASGST